MLSHMKCIMHPDSADSGIPSGISQDERTMSEGQDDINRKVSDFTLEVGTKCVDCKDGRTKAIGVSLYQQDYACDFNDGQVEHVNIV